MPQSLLKESVVALLQLLIYGLKPWHIVSTVLLSHVLLSPQQLLYVQYYFDWITVFYGYNRYRKKLSKICFYLFLINEIVN